MCLPTRSRNPASPLACLAQKLSGPALEQFLRELLSQCFGLRRGAANRAFDPVLSVRPEYDAAQRERTADHNSHRPDGYLAAADQGAQQGPFRQDRLTGG